MNQIKLSSPTLFLQNMKKTNKKKIKRFRFKVNIWPLSTHMTNLRKMKGVKTKNRSNNFIRHKIDMQFKTSSRHWTQSYTLIGMTRKIVKLLLNGWQLFFCTCVGMYLCVCVCVCVVCWLAGLCYNCGNFCPYALDINRTSNFFCSISISGFSKLSKFVW